MRINLVLDYWFDEGGKGGTGNSQDYVYLKQT
jgi:hypothetical protein